MGTETTSNANLVQHYLLRPSANVHIDWLGREDFYAFCTKEAEKIRKSVFVQISAKANEGFFADFLLLFGTFGQLSFSFINQFSSDCSQLI